MPIIRDLKQSRHQNKLSQDKIASLEKKSLAQQTKIRELESELANQRRKYSILLSAPKEKEVVYETREVVNTDEINRLNALLHQMEQENINLRNRPREKEIVVEHREVVNH